MTTKPFKQFRSDTPLSNLDIKCIIEKANKLFSLMTLTDDAEKYLEFNPDLQEAIKKW
jgi:hypothetical protein